ncbi:phosphate ABC transporter substrate-binding protein PstS [Micromonospora sp. NPDC050397]|uniref:phosphate ABC transporter substrate-binding protein PstS n=1 Tax=Micromonospora sp. NPDC050397 TaxID=3364279 RepID=UPI00384C66F5
MRERTSWHRRLLAGLLTLATVAVTAVAGAPAGAAPAGGRNYVAISGSGSTWSENALQAWRAAVRQQGMTVNYSGGGSTVGRNNFREGTVDYAVSEIPYGLEGDGSTRKYAYMPIVAGGTAFMYNLKIGGRRVTNLRLSGEVITKIFTGVIKQWDDPAIKADNPGLNLPARRIVPVVRSDGSGTTAQFVIWMNSQHPGIWRPYCTSMRSATQCNVLSFYPTKPGSGFVAQPQSNGVSGYVAQNHAEGAITYVEYSYALKNSFPVAKVLNSAGYYIEPKATSVAVALTRAEIAADLTQRLDGVYRNADKRSYPLSSYSYMIIPTEPEAGFTQDKGYTLAKFAYYFLCTGQQSADSLGYSPLPKNLVQAGFRQVERIPGAVREDIKLETCHNPTFAPDGTNLLARDAKDPPACDQRGPTQCAEGTGGARQATPTGNGGGNNNSGGTGNQNAGGTNNGGGNSNGGGTNTQNNSTPGTAGPSTGGTPQFDPDTGEVIASGDGGGGQFVAGVPVSLDDEGGWQLRHTMMVLAALILIALVVGPPLLFRRVATAAGGDERGRR